jgi:hypothetical protein
LATSFWVNCVLVTFVFHFIFWLDVYLLGAAARAVSIIAMILYLVLWLALCFWQPVGLYRSAIACIRTTGRPSFFGRMLR